MAIKPILFNTEMVRAIPDGRRKCTRRIVKPQPTNEIQCPLGICTDGYKSEIGKFAFGSHECGGKMIFCKLPYQPGDILYVRESYSELSFGYVYRADGENIDHLGNVIKWHPSVHMPREAARIWLKVTDVRVERLQEISGEDLIKEGIDLFQSNYVRVAFDEFKNIWNSTLKKSNLDCYGWDASPWVWVIEFERCEKPEGV